MSVELAEVMGAVLRILGVIGISAIVTLVAVYLGNRVALDAHGAGFTELATRIGARMVHHRGLLPQLPVLEATYKNHPVRIHFAHFKGRRVTYYLGIPLMTPANFRFEIRPRSILTAKLKRGDPAVETGDPSFDAMFAVESNDSEKMRRLLPASVRRQFIYRAEQKQFGLFRYKGGLLSYSTPPLNSSTPALLNAFHRMLDAAVGFADQLKGSGPQETASMAPPEGEAWPDNDEYLRRLVRDLFGGKWEAAGNASLFAYSYRGVPLLMKYEYGSTPPSLEIAFSVIQKFWLRMLPQTGSDAEDEMLIGNPDLDAMFRIHTDCPDVALPFLSLPVVADALLNAPDFSRFEIYRGKAKVSILRPGARGFRRSQLDRMLEHMWVVLDTYKQQPGLVIVQQTGGGERLCPYCREQLHPESSPIVACSSCRTPHHQACWTENTQCTTWGCASRTAL